MLSVQPGVVLRSGARCRSQPHARDLSRRNVRAAADIRRRLAISQPYLTYGEKGYWPEADYLGVDDATAIWWDPDATGPDEIRKEGVGMYQFVDGGQRYLPGQWPADDKMFDPDRRRRAVHDATAGRSARRLPEPRRLRSDAVGVAFATPVRGSAIRRYGEGGRLPVDRVAGRLRRARRWCG